MKSDVKFDDRKFQAGLAAEAAAMAHRTEAIVKEVGDQVAAHMRTIAPVRTGALRDSITVKLGRTKRGPYVRVGAGVFYAHIVEFGSEDTRPQPFFRPGLEFGKSAMIRMARGVGKG